MAGAVSSCLRGEGRGEGSRGEAEELVGEAVSVRSSHGRQLLEGPLRLLPQGDEKLAISRVRDYLYVSGASELTPQRLRPLGITAVVNCLRGFQQSFGEEVTTLYVPLEDVESQALGRWLGPVGALLDAEREAGGRVLIFCAMGISRSAALAIAYLMGRESLALVEAYRAVQTARPCVCPNVGFFRQLIRLEEEARGKASVAIISPAPGLHVPDCVWEELYDEVMARLSKQRVTST